MKTLLCGMVATFVFSALAFAGPRDADWKRVEDAVQKGLPKTAIEALEPIIKGALADKKHGEATKAIARRIVLEGNIQGNKPEEKIMRLEAEIAKAPAEIKPLLQTILAHWYWQYFQQNRWRFMQRTQTAKAPGKDFTTWDLARIFAEIDKRFSDALSSEKILKATPVSDFNDVLETGTLPDSYRPTLYDFIAQEALQFYVSGEQAAAKPQDAFEISSESPIFDSAEKFLAWKVEGKESAAKAIRLYQQLLKFHQNDKDKSAFIDADIARLVYGKNVAFGEEKTSRFKKAMREVAERWPKHELAAVAWYHYAAAIRDEGNFAEAHVIAERTEKDFPKSNGAALCRTLIEQIEAKSASIQTERIWNAPFPKIEVRYKNVSRVYFRAVKLDWSALVTKRRNVPDYLADEDRQAIMAKQPTLEWSAQLPATIDFKERTTLLLAPGKLAKGFYLIAASHRADFAQGGNQLSIAPIWVSDLGFVIRPREQFIEGFVLNANSGEPIKGAIVNAWGQDYQRDRLEESASLTTDENGFFQFKPSENRSYIFRARFQNDEVGAAQSTSYFLGSRMSLLDQTIFFTDRAIYRPGQAIQYKGISLHVDQSKDNYSVLSGREVEVVFLDANGKEIAKQKHRCNDYGSFTGSFTAPRDRLMG
ncbi:MAG: MG2 domain-containing protein, partial [Verrucomicrobiota bacterium]